MARAIERLVPEANLVPVLGWERHPRLWNWYESPDGKAGQLAVWESFGFPETGHSADRANAPLCSVTGSLGT